MLSWPKVAVADTQRLKVAVAVADAQLLKVAVAVADGQLLKQSFIITIICYEKTL